MTIDTILEHVWRKNPRCVCITGGEPLLQAGEVLKLLEPLHRRGVTIDIETNGTVDFSALQPFASICMDVKCPSSGEKSNLALLEMIRPEDSVKFVVKDESDCQYAADVISCHEIASEIFISPVFGADYKKIARFVTDCNLPVRFQIQLHKIIGVK